MKEKRIEKEIKKAQKKGIYNPKLKLGIVALILVIGTVIGVSYAYYTSNPSTVLNINATVSKRIAVTVYTGTGGHGKVNSLYIATEQADYGTPTKSFKLTPDIGYQYKSISCKDTSNQNVTNKVSVSISNNILTITPNTITDIDCVVEFGEAIEIFDHKYFVKGNLSSTDFAKGCPTNGDTECSGVYKMKDDSNNDSYYFRGEVKNNYVKFGKGTIKNNTEQQDLIWRIVRVNGDGSLRLVLDSDIGTSKFNSTNNERKYAGYTYGNSTPCTNSNPCKYEYNNGTFSSNNTGTSSTIKGFLEEWYQQNLATYDNYITYGTYCNDTSYGSGSETSSILYYGAYQRLRASSSSVTPQLTCPDPTAQKDVKSDNIDSNGYHTYGGVYKLKVGLLSADEIVLAGFRPNVDSGGAAFNYLYYTPSSYHSFWSSSPDIYDTYYALGINGDLDYRYLNHYYVNYAYGVRPVINLKAGTQISSGEGSSSNPFVIKTN